MADLLTCRGCTRCSTLIHNPIPAQQGKERILFIGEAPGREEADEGVPFVGGAGKTLNSILHIVGYRRKYTPATIDVAGNILAPASAYSDVSVSNIIRCRPPNNRDPLPEEIDNCLHWLLDDIEVLKPEFVVCLGLTAAQVVTGKNLEWRGSIVPSMLPGLSGVPALITWHPAFVMRNREEFSTITHDLTKIKPANRPKVYPQNYLYNPPIEAARERIQSWKCPITIDIETYGEDKAAALNPWKAIIIGIAFLGPPGEAVHYSLDEAHPERWAFVQEVLEGYEHQYQNNTFDRCCLELKLGMVTKTPVWDTLDAMHIIYAAAPKNLDYIRSLYTSIAPYKKSYKKKGGGSVSGLAPVDLGLYNCLDVDVTGQAALEQPRYMSDTQKADLKHLLQQDSLAIKMRRHGVYIDKEIVAYNYLTLDPYVRQLENDFFSKHQINPASPKQLLDYLFNKRKLPLPPIKRGKTGPSTDEESLVWVKDHTLVEDDIKLLDELLEYRGAAKLLGTFVQGLYKHIEDDGRVHPNWAPCGTDTGRWSCSAPNLQNPPEVVELPNGGVVQIREQLAAEPGKVLYIADYSQVELIVALTFAGDEDTIDKIVNHGLDVHESVRVLMDKFHPTTRVRAKVIVFGTIYGLTAREGARRFRVPIKVVEGWQQIAVGRFPKLAALREKNEKFFKDHGYIETFWGRRKYCETIAQALNHPIQGTAARVTHNAALRLDREGWHPNINIHDCLACEENEGERTLEEFKEIIQTSSPELRPLFPCKAHIGTSLRDPKRASSRRGPGAQ